MKRIGIVGGLSPMATIEYYRIINYGYKERNRSGDFPEIVLYSVNLTKMLQFAENENWSECITYLADAVNRLELAGADFGFISAGTPHIVFDEVAAATSLPLISIVEATAREITSRKLKKVALLGTRFTMRSDFYQKVFEREGIDTVVPASDEIDYIHQKIEAELSKGEIVEETRVGYLKIIRRMKKDEAIEGVVLGCTEIPLLLTQDEFGLPFLNTTRIHAESAVAQALAE